MPQHQTTVRVVRISSVNVRIRARIVRSGHKPSVNLTYRDTGAISPYTPSGRKTRRSRVSNLAKKTQKEVKAAPKRKQKKESLKPKAVARTGWKKVQVKQVPAKKSPQRKSSFIDPSHLSSFREFYTLAQKDQRTAGKAFGKLLEAGFGVYLRYPKGRVRISIYDPELGYKALSRFDGTWGHLAQLL